MKTFLIYGYVLGLTLASPITKSQEGLRRKDNGEYNGDHEKSACTDIQPDIPKMDPTMQQSINDTISGIQAKNDELGVKKKPSSIEIIRSPILKIQHRRDLSDLTQKLPKKQTKKKPRPNKIIHSGRNVYNASRKMHVNDMMKNKLEKGSIIKQLQKRSVDYDDAINIPYHSPDISYDWDSQEDLIEKEESQDQNDSAAKSAEDISSDIISNDTDPSDSNESDHTRSNESNNPTGSPESNHPMEPNDSNSSNESSYNTDSIGDVTTPIVLDEESDSLEYAEPNVGNGAFTAAVTEDTNGPMESRPSSESESQDSSSQSNEPDKPSKASHSDSNESSNSSDSNTSSHSTESTPHVDNSSENSSHHIGSTVITDVIEEDELTSEVRKLGILEHYVPVGRW